MWLKWSLTDAKTFLRWLLCNMEIYRREGIYKHKIADFMVVIMEYVFKWLIDDFCVVQYMLWVNFQIKSSIGSKLKFKARLMHFIWSIY